jgi:hypothetical protein
MIPSKSAADFDAAFTQIKRERPDALVVSSIPLFREHSKEMLLLPLTYASRASRSRQQWQGTGSS